MGTFTLYLIHKIDFFRSINKRKYSTGRELSNSSTSVFLHTCGVFWDASEEKEEKLSSRWGWLLLIFIKVEIWSVTSWKHQSFTLFCPLLSLFSCYWKLNRTVSSTYGQSIQLNMKWECTSPLHSFVQTSTSWCFHGLWFLQTNRLRSILVFCQLQAIENDNTQM